MADGLGAHELAVAMDLAVELHALALGEVLLHGGELLGKTPAEALAWGPVNSMSVVQHIGAQVGLLTRDKLEEYLKNAPADYKAKRI